MESTTRFSPVSYPTTSRHVGSETEIAWGVKGGTGLPRVLVVSVKVAVVEELMVERRQEADSGMC